MLFTGTTGLNSALKTHYGHHKQLGVWSVPFQRSIYLIHCGLRGRLATDTTAWLQLVEEPEIREVYLSLQDDSHCVGSDHEQVLKPMESSPACKSCEQGKAAGSAIGAGELMDNLPRTFLEPMLCFHLVHTATPTQKIKIGTEWNALVESYYISTRDMKPNDAVLTVETMWSSMWPATKVGFSKPVCKDPVFVTLALIWHKFLRRCLSSTPELCANVKTTQTLISNTVRTEQEDLLRNKHARQQNYLRELRSLSDTTPEEIAAQYVTMRTLHQHQTFYPNEVNYCWMDAAIAI